VTVASKAVWQWPNGAEIEWGTDSDVEYMLSEDIITAPDGTLIVDPAALVAVVAHKGAAPSGYGLCCVYRDRVIVALDNLWYASRMGAHGDWDYGADASDGGRAVAGSVGPAGKISGDITALIPFRDKILLIATSNSLYMLSGDPADGNMSAVNEEVGVVAPYGWALEDSLLAFLSNDGVYVGGIGEAPTRFSDARAPELLRNVDVEGNTITMSYDPVGRGFHLFITPDAPGVGETDSPGQHFWLDLENKAVWPVAFADTGHQPVAACRLKNETLEDVVLLGRDGVWRRFDATVDDDDGEDLSSTVVLGPVVIAPNDTDDAILAEITGVLAHGSGAVTWGVSVGSSAEEAADNAVAGVFADSGTWTELRNPVARPRVRGAWAAVSLTSTEKWAYESVVLARRQLGRLR
jgi:hypothetical protein